MGPEQADAAGAAAGGCGLSLKLETGNLKLGRFESEADMWIDMMTVVRVVQVVLIVLALVVMTDAALRK